MNSFFFFFQAEDGIRDHCVTGVQTCALPISGALGLAFGEQGRREHRGIDAAHRQRAVEGPVCAPAPSPVALPFIAKVESVTSGRNGSVKPDAVTSKSNADPFGVILATRLSGPRT